MPHLLHLDSAGRRDGRTRGLTELFATTWRQHNPSGTSAYRDVVANPVPHIDNDATMLLGSDPQVWSAQQRAGWAVFEELLTEVERADALVLGVPMYNFTVPSAFKAWTDRVAGVPGRSLNVGTLKGNYTNKQVTVISARGGAYTPGTPRAPFDHQEPWLRDMFRELMGFEDVHFIHAEMTNARTIPALAQFSDFEDASHSAARAEVIASAARTAKTAA
jgi:FMN-dependent NADH-azoreductase